MIDHLLRQTGDPDVANLLGVYAIYFLPVVNPDGHYADQRENAMGSDLNRDFSHPDRSDADSREQHDDSRMKPDDRHGDDGDQHGTGDH